jgi:U3 small nucleolar RNA-associated protein 15
MTHVSYPYKKTNKSVFQKPASVQTPDSIYWKKLGVIYTLKIGSSLYNIVIYYNIQFFQLPVLVKEFGAIDYIDFSPIEPYYFAATCSVRVQVIFTYSKVFYNVKRLQTYNKQT